MIQLTPRPGRAFGAGALLLLSTHTVGCGPVLGWPAPCTTCDTAETGETGTPDTTPPQVRETLPSAGSLDVALSTPVVAIFDEEMDATSLNPLTFLLERDGAPIEGVVTQFGITAIFYPTSPLSAEADYTATITTGATDPAGNGLAADYLWSFQTGSDPDGGHPTVITTTPGDGESNVALAADIRATFSEPMDPLSIDTERFTVRGPDGIEVTGLLVYDTSTNTATLTPDDALEPYSTYLARITSEVTDLAGNPMRSDHLWAFSTTGIDWDLAPVELGSLSTFVAVSGAGLTNSNSSGTTTLNGDVGLSPIATCLGDGVPCTATNPVINGTLYANDAYGVAERAKVDLTAAYIDAMSRPPGTVVSDLSGRTLAPGVYTSASTMSIAVGGTVILDGQGNPDAVWIFQVGSSLTVNDDAQILLVDGASAKNVFWAAFGSTTLGAGVHFQGSVFAGASNSVGTDSSVVGRLLCTTGQITLLSNDITLPPT